jgi:hypothetical protein
VIQHPVPNVRAAVSIELQPRAGCPWHSETDAGDLHGFGASLTEVYLLEGSQFTSNAVMNFFYQS